MKKLFVGILMVTVMVVGVVSVVGAAWFHGGNLHNTTVGQWQDASYSNKLATSGDWLASTLWKGHLNTPGSFDKCKVQAKKLVLAVNTVAESSPRSLNITEIALLIIIRASGDLGPY